MSVRSVESYRESFTAFYDGLVEVYPDRFVQGGPCRVGSTFKVPGAAGLDAQTFYMRHILDLVFNDRSLVGDLVALARAAYQGKEPSAEAISRLAAAPHLHETLYRATEAASGLTARIGRWPQGTDLFANALTNVDCALQMAGLYDHAAERRRKGGAAASGTMDQGSIDALFG